MASSQSILSFLGFIPDLLVLIFCIMYMSKVQHSESSLLFIGSLLRVLVRIFYFVMPYISRLGDYGSDSMMNYISAAGGVGLLGSILFCAGFVLLLKRVMSGTVQVRT